MMMLRKKNLARWLRTLLNTTSAKKHNRGTQARTGRKMLLESLERREVFAADFASDILQEILPRLRTLDSLSNWSIEMG